MKPVVFPYRKFHVQKPVLFSLKKDRKSIIFLPDHFVLKSSIVRDIYENKFPIDIEAQIKSGIKNQVV